MIRALFKCLVMPVAVVYSQFIRNFSARSPITVCSMLYLLYNVLLNNWKDKYEDVSNININDLNREGFFFF